MIRVKNSNNISKLKSHQHKRYKKDDIWQLIPFNLSCTQKESVNLCYNGNISHVQCHVSH